MSTTSATLLALPNELLVSILSALDARSLARCISTCTHLRRLITESSFLVYLLELSKSGLSHTANNHVPHSQLLEHLRQYENAWDKLDLQPCPPISIGPDCRAYELVGGTFSKSGGADLIVTSLPTTPQQELRITKHTDVGIRLRDFAIDPTQDVIAMMELSVANPLLEAQYRVHLRSVETNKPHPEAKQPVLTFSRPGATAFNSASMHFAENILAVHLYSPDASPSTLILWDWKTGVLVPTAEFDEDARSNDFILLNNKSFLWTSTAGSGSLFLYAFSPSSAPYRVATFPLPGITPHAAVVSILPHSSPIHANPTAGSSFYQPSDSFIIVISVTYAITNAEAVHYLSFFVHNAFFQSYVRRFLEGEASGHLYVPWSDWGYRNTRLMPRTVSHNWLRYVHGTRVVSSLESRLLVFDFSHTLRPREMQLRKDPTLMNLPDLFPNPVKTALPYYVTHRPLDRLYYSFMIDDRRLIGLTIDDDEEMRLHPFIVA